MNRLPLMVALALMVFTGSVFAQSDALVTTVTQGGMSVTVPSAYELGLYRADELRWTLFDAQRFERLSLRSADPDFDTAGSDAALDAYLDSIDAEYDPALRETITTGANGVLAQPASTMFGAVYVMLIQTPDGRTAFLELIDSSSEDITEHRDLLTSIAGSLQFGVEPPPLPTDIELPALDFPEGALAVEQMPEGTIIFSSNIQLTLPQGWQAGSINDEGVEDRVSLENDAYPDIIFNIETISLLEYLTEYSDWYESLKLTYASIYGLDPASLQSEPLDAAGMQENSQLERLTSEDGSVVLYFIDLNGHAAVAFEVYFFTDDEAVRTAVNADIETIARSVMRFTRTTDE